MQKIFKKILGGILVLYAVFVAVFGYFSYKYTNAYETEAVGVVVPIYWDELEKERMNYDFSKTDALLSQAKGSGLSATIALGFKLPSKDGNLAECNFPEWYDHGAVQTEKDKQLFQMIRNVVNEYEDNDSVTAWQIEHDSFNEKDGCPDADAELLNLEIKLVEGVDDGNKNIIVERGNASLGDFWKWVKSGLRSLR